MRLALEQAGQPEAARRRPDQYGTDQYGTGFHPAYQLQIDWGSGAVVSTEARARRTHPQFGVI